MTLLVTAQSQLLFRLADHHSFRKDNIIGERKLSILKVLLCFNGKCENLEVTLGMLLLYEFLIFLALVQNYLLLCYLLSLSLPPRAWK